MLVGATASGKSDLAMAVAAAAAPEQVEIVAVDAMQVYRGMDIGTAKPPPADQQRVAHHCIDLVDPWEPFNVADFQRAARRALGEIATRSHTACLVAGTGLYLTAVIDDLELPGEWPEIRAALVAERAGAFDGSDLHDRLRALDPAGAAKIEPTNDRRILRALEVCLGSGRPFSSFGPGTGAYPANGIAQIGLRWSREALTARIGRRVDEMIAAGLLDELRTLLAGPGLSATARQALGYRELIAHVERRCSLAEATAEIALRTRQFAVRQERWFRRDPRVRWVDITRDAVADVLPAVEELLA